MSSTRATRLEMVALRGVGGRGRVHCDPTPSLQEMSAQAASMAPKMPLGSQQSRYRVPLEKATPGALVKPLCAVAVKEPVGPPGR